MDDARGAGFAVPPALGPGRAVSEQSHAGALRPETATAEAKRNFMPEADAQVDRAAEARRATLAVPRVPDAAALWLPLGQLRRWEKNPRKNDPAAARVAASIRRFGFVAPIVVWTSANRMVAGDTRLKAMRLIERETPTFVPRGAPGPGMARVVFHEFDSEAEADLYALADNRLNEIAEWDEDARDAILVGYDDEARIVAGFDGPIVEPGASLPGEDVIPEPPAAPTTQAGDLWLLGAHRLLCGDSTDAAALSRVMEGAQADLLWTDPPYNVDYVGGTRDALTIQNDSMDDESFHAFLVAAFTSANAVMRDGAVFYIAHADTNGFTFRAAVRDVGWKLAQCLIWVKDVFVMGRQDYHWRHEPILYGWKQGAGHHAVADRTQDTVWEIDRPKRSVEHPTMKPVELVERAIRNNTDPGQHVLDPFAGSGTTLVAATRTGRTAHLVELDPRYCDVVVERWQTLTGEKAARIAAVEAA